MYRTFSSQPGLCHAESLVSLRVCRSLYAHRWWHWWRLPTCEKNPQTASLLCWRYFSPLAQWFPHSIIEPDYKRKIRINNPFFCILVRPHKLELAQRSKRITELYGMNVVELPSTHSYVVHTCSQALGPFWTPRNQTWVRSGYIWNVASSSSPACTPECPTQWKWAVKEIAAPLMSMSRSSYNHFTF